MTLEQIAAEAQRLPRDEFAQLFDRLLAAAEMPDAEIDSAWMTETRRRIAEIESGKETGIPGEEVMAEIRKIVKR